MQCSGYLVDAAWLTAHGIAYETFRDYVKRGWLERLTRGVFRRPFLGTSASDTIDWKICLLSVQHIMGHDVHVGGMTRSPSRVTATTCGWAVTPRYGSMVKSYRTGFRSCR